MDKETLIDKFIGKKLTAEEREVFDSLLRDDNSFREEVAFRENLAAVAYNNEAQVLKERLNKVEKGIKGKGKNTLRRVLLIVVGILLIATAVIGYQYEKMKKSTDGIYASHYEVYPNVYHPVTRGSSDALTKAFLAYENGDFESAADLLGENIKTNRDIPLKFYQAMAYGEMGNYPLAIKNLENIRRFDSPYLAECYWYLGLYYVKQGNKAAAVPRFQDFYELSEDEERKKEAAKLIHQLQG